MRLRPRSIVHSSRCLFLPRSYYKSIKPVLSFFDPRSVVLLCRFRAGMAKQLCNFFERNTSGQPTTGRGIPEAMRSKFRFNAEGRTEYRPKIVLPIRDGRLLQALARPERMLIVLCHCQNL